MSSDNRLGITAGDVWVSGGNDYYEPRLETHEGIMLAHAGNAMPSKQNACNFRLYADAHNTANRTGKLPSELEKDAIKWEESALHSRICEMQEQQRANDAKKKIAALTRQRDELRHALKAAVQMIDFAVEQQMAGSISNDCITVQIARIALANAKDKP